MIFKTSGNLPVLLLLALQALFLTQGCSSCQEEETSQPTPRPRDMGSARADMTMSEDDADMGAADLTNLPRLTDILLSSPQATLEVGTSQSLSYRVIDQEGEDLTQSTQLLWSNLDAGVAELRLDADSPGTFSIRGTRRGTTTLTASTLSGEVMATLDVEVTPRKVVTITISPQQVEVIERDTAQLRARVLGSDDFELVGRQVLWESASDQIATVNASGLVTGQSAGMTTITARLDGVSQSVPVQVEARPVTRIDILTPTPSLLVNDTVMMEAVARDDRGGVLANRQITWSVVDEGVAQIDPVSGELTAVSAGATQVVATLEGLTQDTTVEVANRPVTRVELLPQTGTISVGQTIAFTAMVHTDDGSLHPNQQVTWSVSSTSDALADLGGGVFEGINVGSARVRAASQETPGIMSDESVVQVTPVVDRVAITPPGPLTLTVGENASLQATVYDTQNQTIVRQVTWSSSDAGVASVDINGDITALQAGQTTITAEVAQISASIVVDVIPAAIDRIELSPAGPITLPSGSTLTLQATLRDAQNNVLTGRALTWSSSDVTVATVDASGEVTAIATGQARVQVESEGVMASVVVVVPDTFVDVIAGGSHTCVMTDAMALHCAGRNQFSVLGLSGSMDRLTLEFVSSAHSFTEISLLTLHQCGITDQNKMYCWGANFAGQLGDGTTLSSAAMIAIAPAMSFAQVSAGGAHTCALTLTGEAWCWGSNDYGQLGTGDVTQQNEPTPVMGGRTFTQIAAGGSHTCALEAVTGELLCWGRNDVGQLGIDNNFTSLLAPTEVDNARAYLTMSAGPEHTCAITQGAQQTYCFGGNSDGQLGVDTQGASRVMHQLVPGNHTFTSVVAAPMHTCALTDAQEAYCWGANNNGQLGDGTTTSSAAPVAIDAPVHASWLKLDLGGLHSCGLTTDGFVYCWGSGSNGRLGNGSLLGALSPYPLAL